VPDLELAAAASEVVDVEVGSVVDLHAPDGDAEAVEAGGGLAQEV